MVATVLSTSSSLLETSLVSKIIKVLICFQVHITYERLVMIFIECVAPCSQYCNSNKAMLQVRHANQSKGSEFPFPQEF